MTHTQTFLNGIRNKKIESRGQFNKCEPAWSQDHFTAILKTQSITCPFHRILIIRQNENFAALTDSTIFVAYLTFTVSHFDFENSFGRTLGIAYTALFRHLAKLLKEKDLPITPDQFRVLTHLWQRDGLSQQELAFGSNRDRANVTRIIDILEREGIVKRNDHESDRRVYRIELTKKGKELEKDAAECGQVAINDALNGITKAELEICMKVLRKTIENLK